MERIIGNLNCIEAATKEWRSDASALHPAANNDNADANDNNNGNAADNTDNELLIIQMKILIMLLLMIILKAVMIIRIRPMIIMLFIMMAKAEGLRWRDQRTPPVPHGRVWVRGERGQCSP